MTLNLKTEAPLLDDAIVRQLTEVLGPAVGAIFSRGREQVVQLAEKIERVSGQGDSMNVADLAHELGGVAGQVGLARLSRTALALEQALRSGAVPNPDDAAALKSLALDSVERLPA